MTHRKPDDEKCVRLIVSMPPDTHRKLMTMVAYGKKSRMVRAMIEAEYERRRGRSGAAIMERAHTEAATP